jgi:NADPH-dependent glutamate synthase beta subunit-like oxidoreductase
MNRRTEVVNDPYLGYQPARIAAWSRSCLECSTPAPCTTACLQGIHIPEVVKLAGRAACEGLALTRWFRDREEVEGARITDAIADCYNT